MASPVFLAAFFMFLAALLALRSALLSENQSTLPVEEKTKQTITSESSFGSIPKICQRTFLKFLLKVKKKKEIKLTIDMMSNQVRK